MDLLAVLLLMVLSVIAGIAITLIAQWYLFNRYMMRVPYVGPPDKPNIGQFRIPQLLVEALQSSDVPKKESCLALNLLFQFLFKELRNAQKVRHWFRHKLSLEFEELLMRTTTGKLFDKVTIRDINLGTQFPAIKSITVKDAVVHPDQQHIDSLDLCLDLDYSGGFQLSIDANMLLGKAAYLAVKVNHLSGQARLQFTRHPYTHWSFSFYTEPLLELEVESQFQGRPLPQINSIIISQIRKALKKKHTLPNYKLRYKPFFAKSEPGEEDEWSVHNICPGTLHVSVVEVTRLMSTLVAGDVYCSLAVDCTAWVEMFHSDTSSFMTLDLMISKPLSQQLGFVFKQEFVAESYQPCVMVETVVLQSPASAADVRRGDIVAAVDGKRVSSMAQAARLIKAAGQRFTLRVERKSNYRLHNSDPNIDKPQDKEGEDLYQGLEDVGVGSGSQVSLPESPQLTRSGLRQRRGSADKTESDSSSSSPASIPGSPAKKPSLFSRSSQSSPEHQHRAAIKLTEKRGSVDRDDKTDPDSAGNVLQLNKTKELLPNQVLVFDETMTFQVDEEHRYLNVSVWSKAGSDNSGVRSSPVRGARDILLGHISIPLGAIVAECGTTKLGHHIKSYSLLPPDPHIAMSNNHRLMTYSGFEPCLCYGDILLSFLYSTPSSAPSPSRPPVSPMELGPSSQLLQPKMVEPQERKRQHDFIRTHFHRTTQCEFCGKKIWLKDAVQCRDCAMTCHKKCVSKCQQGTVCGAHRRASALSEEVSSSDLLAPANQARRASAQPEIITTLADDEEAAPQASLVGNPFELTHSLLDNDVSAALDHLLQHPNDDNLMDVAKSTGRDLYSDMSLPDRKDKINSMIVKLKAAMDTETQSRMALAREEQEARDPGAHTRTAFLIGKSDEKVQALAVLMLHFCAGLQHTQDLEDSNKVAWESNPGCEGLQQERELESCSEKELAVTPVQ